MAAATAIRLPAYGSRLPMREHHIHRARGLSHHMSRGPPARLPMRSDSEQEKKAQQNRALALLCAMPAAFFVCTVAVNSALVLLGDPRQERVVLGCIVHLLLSLTCISIARAAIRTSSIPGSYGAGGIAPPSEPSPSAVQLHEQRRDTSPLRHQPFPLSAPRCVDYLQRL